jgi:hypothetical protein
MGYVLAGYGITLVAIGAYAAALVVRVRHLRKVS